MLFVLKIILAIQGILNIQPDSIEAAKITANVRVYDQLRCNSDAVSRYTIVKKRDNIRNLMPSN